MTPRDIVHRAIHHQHPARLPVNMPSLGVSDWAPVAMRRPVSFVGVQPGADEWDCVWQTTAVSNMGQPLGHPLHSAADIARMTVPDYHDDSRYRDAEASLQAAETANKYRTCGIFMVLFERMHALYGFENTLMDLYQDRAAMAELADRIVDVHVDFVHEVQRRFPGRIDGWTMSDDWGTQEAAFISLDLWMDFFLPRYARIFDAMHADGADVIVHSCGRINEIIEGYIAAGVDAVNLQQPRALGIEAIGRRYHGRIAFVSLSDIQRSLPSGCSCEIERDAADLLRWWADTSGGFVLGDYGDDAAIGVADPDAKRTMYAAFSRGSQALYGAPLPGLPDPAAKA